MGRLIKQYILFDLGSDLNSVLKYLHKDYDCGENRGAKSIKVEVYKKVVDCLYIW